MYMYCFIHLAVSFENMDMLRSKLLSCFDHNNVDFLINSFLEEGYHKDTVIFNKKCIEFRSWVRNN